MLVTFQPAASVADPPEAEMNVIFRVQFSDFFKTSIRRMASACGLSE
ncbi:hypothetical protein RMSM_03266 [Rhodopirellula maiorica SM1]|uniref:Uncharacterized protein n=1 Tax=Rhodopirellula maiorica SM1 TaxID=1265738 RepID=M5RKG1_9BACT|nr:hypothetical protein RMSM_03266 [Rhodopirellula maiorica SM1]